MLRVIDVLGIERRVIKQDLDAIRARFFQAASRPQIQQIAKAAGASLVISSLLVREQQSGILRAALGGGQSPFGIEQNCGRVWSEDFGDKSLEFFHHRVGNFAAFFFGERLLQRTTLIHGSGSNDSALVRHSFQPLQFARGKFHFRSSRMSSVG